MHIRDMLTGYARVSTDDQDLTLQRAAFKCHHATLYRSLNVAIADSDTVR